MIMINQKKKALVIFLTFILFNCNYLIQTVDSTVHDNIPNQIINSRDISEWWWTDIELISSSSTDHSYYPNLAIDGDIIHLIWIDETADLLSSGGDRDIFYIQGSISTQTWSALELVSSESSSNCYNPRLLVDSDGVVHVVWGDETDYLGCGTDDDIFYKRRSATGIWTDAEVVSVDSTSHVTFSPILDLDSSGRLYIFWEDSTDILGAGVDKDIWYNYYDFQTSSWNGMTLITPESITTSQQANIIIDSSDDLHFVWSEGTDLLGSGTDRDIFYKKYDSSEDTWSSISAITTFSDESSDYPWLEIDSSGKIHIVWSDYSDYDGDAVVEYDVVYSYFDTSLGIWAYPELISKNCDDISMVPLIKVDNEEYIHVLWFDASDYALSGAQYDVFYAYNNRNGIWSDVAVVTPDSNQNADFPSFDIDDYGILHCVWDDYTDYLSSGFGFDIFYRKLAGNPGTPTLYPISPFPTYESNVSLSWSDEFSAKGYDIYRSTEFIDDVSELTIIGNSVDNSYIDTLNETGVYYYTIVATNDYGTSEISNVVSVDYQPSKTSFSGLFEDLNWGEIIIIGGVLGTLQIVTAIVVVISNTSGKSSNSSKKGKKK